jgi:hypothetical protein
MFSDPRQFRWGRLVHTSPQRIFREGLPVVDFARRRGMSLRASGPEVVAHRAGGAGLTGEGTGGAAGVAQRPGGALSPHPLARHVLPPADECLQARASDVAGPERVYELRVKIRGRWERVDLIRAPSHAVALSEASLRLTPAHAELPISLEQLQHDDEAPQQQSPHGRGEPAA